MLRVEFQNAANTLTLRIEGRLVGTFAEEARTLVTRCKIQQRLLVDVSEVTYVDAAGEQVLAWLGGIGAEFVADGSYPRDVCERLELPLMGERSRSRLAGEAHSLPRSQSAHRS